MPSRLTQRCPACGSPELTEFYTVSAVPVHSVLLLPTREEAIGFPTGDIVLAFCESCGFIFNRVFDARLHQYSQRYEETQGFSPTFSAFHKNLATRLVERYDLHNKTVIEIGCGKGEFLSMLCELGNNQGIGFDPAYVPDRNVSPMKDRMTVIQDLYSEKYASYQADFVCCKMTLEHIPDVAEFMKTVRRSIGERHDTVIFFQIPEVRRILRENAFWDIYYEHCSYFSQGSLARLFRATGFDVVDLGTEYDDQYLTIEARPSSGRALPRLHQEEPVDSLKRDVEQFIEHLQINLDRWQKRLAGIRSGGRKVVIWGGGSKGVAFLTKLGIREEIRYAVDINPFKSGTFMAGTGQEIVLPQFLKEYRPDLIIVMNPIYIPEISADLKTLGVNAELLPITG